MNPNDDFYPHYYPDTQYSQESQSYETTPNTQPPPNPTQNDPESQNTKSTNTAVSWEPIEDVALMSAWVHVSGNAVVGTNQKGDTLWLAIHKLYEQARAENPGKLSKRSVESMRARYQRLNKNVTKWVGCLREANMQKSSGMSTSDVETIAHQMYNQKSGFPHTMVYEQVMCQVNKWKLDYGGGQRRPHPDAADSDQEGHGSSKKSRTTDDDDDIGPSNTPVSGASAQDRPTGREAGKAKRKGRGPSSSTNVVIPAIPDEFTHELRAMRITRENELKVRVDLEQKKNNTSVLNALLAKANLTPQEEDIKNRLLADLFN